MKIGKDKFLHAIVCLGATVTIGLLMFWQGKVASCFCGGLFALGLGLGKEYGDSKASGNKWDNWDIVADCVGIVLGIVPLLIIVK